LLNLTSEASHHQISQDKIKDLKKYVSGLDTILNSSPKLKQHLQKPEQLSQTNNTEQHNDTDTRPSKRQRNHVLCVESQGQESYEENSMQEIIDEKNAAPLSRQRTLFDPLNEVPRLKEWFEENPSPSKSTINYYVDELNASEIRRGKNPVTDRAVYIWFKNTRARKLNVKNIP
jgi:hypothetical protein